MAQDDILSLAIVKIISSPLIRPTAETTSSHAVVDVFVPRNLPSHAAPSTPPQLSVSSNLPLQSNPAHIQNPSNVLDSFYISTPSDTYDVYDPADPLDLPTRVDPPTWPNVCNPPHQFYLPHTRTPSQPLHLATPPQHAHPPTTSLTLPHPHKRTQASRIAARGHTLRRLDMLSDRSAMCGAHAVAHMRLSWAQANLRRTTLCAHELMTNAPRLLAPFWLAAMSSWRSRLHLRRIRNIAHASCNASAIARMSS